LKIAGFKYGLIEKYNMISNYNILNKVNAVISTNSKNGENNNTGAAEDASFLLVFVLLMIKKDLEKKAASDNIIKTGDYSYSLNYNFSYYNIMEYIGSESMIIIPKISEES